MVQTPKETERLTGSETASDRFTSAKTGVYEQPTCGLLSSEFLIIVLEVY